MANPTPQVSKADKAKIASKEAAIKRRLSKDNAKAKGKALASVKSQAVKNKGSGKTFTKSYTGQGIAGKDKGFTKSDYGVLEGAAIPYQITKNLKSKVSATASKGPKRTPKPISNSKGKGHTTYKVKRGDTLSGIAKKHNKDWRDIWSYNLKHRSKKTQSTLKKRGPHLIFKGGTFYIPK